MQITTNGARVVNGNVITGDPALSIVADDVVFFNENGGVLKSTGATAVQIGGARNRIVNEAGGVIQALSDNAVAITGSAFDDTIENAGTILGKVNLGDGADTLIQNGGTVSGAVDFGAGNDTLIVQDKSGYLGGTMFGGAGIDTLIYQVMPAFYVATSGFERLQVQLDPTQSWNTTITGDFTDISLTGSSQRPLANLLDTVLPDATVTINGVDLILNYNTVVKNVIGSSNSETLEFASAPAYAYPPGKVTGFADLGGGDDFVSFYSTDGKIAAPSAPIRGGDGRDTISFSSAVDAQLDLQSFAGFETLTIGAGFITSATHTVLHVPDVETIRTFGTFSTDGPNHIVIAATDRSNAAIVTSGNSVIQIAADATVGKIIDASADPSQPFTATAQNVDIAGRAAGDLDLRGENDLVTNHGRIDGSVLLGDGADRYVESASTASVGGMVDGGAGDDRIELLSIRAGAATSFDGGAGTDLLSFANGTGHVTLDLAAGTATDGTTTISVLNFEKAFGTDQGDILLGTAGANSLSGFGGDDRIDGNDGDDLLFGGSGNDVLLGGAGNDTLVGDIGNDTLQGSDGDDRLDPGLGRNVVDGGAGMDTLVLAGVRSDYTATKIGNTLFLRAGDEVQRVTDVETVNFANASSTATDLLAQATSFNALDYIASYSDLRAAFGTDTEAATQHYLGSGFYEGRTVTFNGLKYIASYSDLIGAFGTDEAAAAEHYIRYGAAEGRTVTFDPLRYIASYSDLIAAFGTDQVAATEHYIRDGAAEGRIASFDALRYIASYSDLIAAFGTDQTAATEHYIRDGAAEGRTANFDALRYIASYSDLIAAFGTDQTAATEHYIRYGAAEGRTAGFDPVGYLLGNPDLQAAGLGADGAVIHWIRYGAAEGRAGDSIFGHDQTSHLVEPGGSTADQLQSAGDRDWFEIKMASGEALHMELKTSAFAGHIEVHDSAGHLLAESDGAMGNNALVDFAAPSADTYYVVAAANAGSGTYMLSFEPI